MSRDFLNGGHPFFEQGDQSWRTEAACRGMDANLFFPKRGKTIAPEAAAACARCPVTAECEQYAILNQQALGWWGGKSPDQRARRTITARDAAKDNACKRGHELVGENVYVETSTGRRRCVQCKQETNALLRARQKGQAA